MHGKEKHILPQSPSFCQRFLPASCFFMHACDYKFSCNNKCYSHGNIPESEVILVFWIQIISIFGLIQHQNAGTGIFERPEKQKQQPG
jgi:hypothetical protein